MKKLKKPGRKSSWTKADIRLLKKYRWHIRQAKIIKEKVCTKHTKGSFGINLYRLMKKLKKRGIEKS